MSFRFGAFEVDFQLFELRRDGERVHIDRKAFDLLRYLVEHRDRVIDKEELLANVWGGDSVVDAVIPTAIARLRKALGQSRTENVPIETLHGRGYRFTASVGAAAPSDGPSRPSAPLDTDVHPLVRDPFVGRDDVMQRLRATLDKALAGTLRARLLVGDPGMGKTRVTTELANIARKAGARVLMGRCPETTTPEHFFPWIQILRQVSGPRDHDAWRAVPSSLRGELLALLPELGADVTGLSTPPRESAEREGSSRLGRFEAVCRWLGALAQRTPLVLVLDDLHWADTDSLALLEHVIQELGTSPILLLATYRDAELPPLHPHAALLDRLERASSFKRIALAPFDVPEIAQYLQELTSRAVPGALAERVHARTGGNPFFVREVARSLTHAALDEAAPPPEIVLPSAARDVVRRRIAALPAEAQRVLCAASVLGHPFDFAMLASMVDGDRAVMLAALDRALAARLLARAEPEASRYAFTHDLVRETIYLDVPSAERVALHARALHALEKQRVVRSVPLVELALHAHHALPQLDPNRVCELCMQAAEQASAAGQPAGAAEWYERAQRSLAFATNPDADRAGRLMVALGRARHASGHPHAAREALEQAIELDQHLGTEPTAWGQAARAELARLPTT